MTVRNLPYAAVHKLLLRRQPTTGVLVYGAVQIAARMTEHAATVRDHCTLERRQLGENDPTIRKSLLDEGPRWFSSRREKRKINKFYGEASR